MKVTAIIPTLANETTRPYLRLCVESLRATTDWDIVVVTNGTRTAETLGIDGITTRLHTRDQGQANAVNIGVQVAAPDTDYIFVSNDDMYYAPGWFNHVEGAEYPLVWSPNLIEPTNNNGSAAPFLKLDAGFTLEEFNRNLVDRFVKAHEDNQEENGFNLPFFVKKGVWNTIGGYDVAYDPWGSGSDTDLQMKFELAGITPKRLRDHTVYHFSNKSGTFDGTHQDYWQNNWDYLQSKWGFNRDEAGSDTWYCKDMIMWDKLKYHPKWEGRFK